MMYICSGFVEGCDQTCIGVVRGTCMWSLTLSDLLFAQCGMVGLGATRQDPKGVAVQEAPSLSPSPLPPPPWRNHCQATLFRGSSNVWRHIPRSCNISR